MYIRGRYIALGLVATVVLSSGVTMGAMNYTNKTKQAAQGLNDPQFSKLLTAYQTLQQNYYQNVKSDTLLNGAIDGMVKSLDDPYSEYMDPKTAQSFQENISSSFEGIGAEIKAENGHIMIVSPIKGSPAEKAGLKPNDIILKVDGTSLDNMSVNDAVLKIRGKKGSKAALVIQRAGSGQLNVALTRDTIPLDTVDHKMLQDGMGEIAISKFAETTTDEFTKALTDLKGKGMKGLIVDLRQDPGGLLNCAVDIGNMLVPDQKVILQVEDRTGKKEVYRSKKGKADFPIVVMVDGGSASAAEILAAALHESGGYPLVGDKSFGKGTVQTTVSFNDTSNIKYTMAKWLTPNGNWIHKKGLQPDYPVALPAYANVTVIDPSKELAPDTFSNDIKSAQIMLDAIGYHPGRQDGFYDDKTRDAVIAFQKMNNLPATGTIKGETATKLQELVQVKIKDNDTQLQRAEQVLRKMLP
jgi:carboxyl-terminal processing protease